MMVEYETVIGLEVHVQLSTKSKIFCGCSTQFGAAANTHTCPVCLGLPGVLPVFNEEVLNLAIKVALALHCKISAVMKFDRKNYYYPDLPKNFQISQYEMPLCQNGFLEIKTEAGVKSIGIKRAHLEEDAGKLIHEQERSTSLVDYNRTGIPLLEIVTDPDITSPEEAYTYLVALKAILQYLGVSDCNMEEGSLRCDANISIRPRGSKELGAKVEVKNMNTFKGVRAALSYEAERQRSVLQDGEVLRQETRLWDAERGMTTAMRSKEEAHDYRYFPEPDLVPFEIKEGQIDRLGATLPELPHARMERYQKAYGLSSYDASVLVNDKGIADYFEACVKLLDKPKALANWITQDMAYELNVRKGTIEALNVSPEQFVALVTMIESGAVSGKIAKEVLRIMMDTGKDAAAIIKEKGLTQVSSEDEIRAIVSEVIQENQKSVDDYRGGKEQVLAYLVGQAMKKTRGRANPQLLNKILKEVLKGG